MRTTILCGLIACAALVASGRSAWAGGGGEGAIAWRKSLPAAQAEAKRSHKLLMVDFYTSWCGFCKKLDAETYTDANVIRLSEKVVTVKVDAERDGRQLAEKYGVTGFPTILFLNETGGVEGMIGGFLPAYGFAKSFNDTMQRHQNFVLAQARYQKNSNDVKTAFDLEGFYAAQGNGAQTLAMQKQVERMDPQNAKGLLSRSCLYLGDFYSMRHAFDKSVPLYRRAIHLTREPRDIAYGHLSLAYCSLSQNHLKQALPELKAVQAVSKCPLELKGAAQQLLDKLKQQGVQ
jgi:thiol-disulfide isomerase/thioredoxin